MAGFYHRNLLSSAFRINPPDYRVCRWSFACALPLKITAGG